MHIIRCRNDAEPHSVASWVKLLLILGLEALFLTSFGLGLLDLPSRP